MRNTKKEYYRSAFLASLQGAEIAPLEEVLGVSLEVEASSFDSDKDAEMERRARQLLAERKAMKNV